MPNASLSIIGGILLLITASYDYYVNKLSRDDLWIVADEVETKDGEIDHDQLPAIGSARFRNLDKKLLTGYSIAITVEIIGLFVYFGVV